MMRTITSVVLAVVLAVVSAGTVEGASVGVPAVTSAGVGVVDEAAAVTGNSVSRWALYWYIDHMVGCDASSSSDESNYDTEGKNCEEVGQHDDLAISMICTGAGVAGAVLGVATLGAGFIGAFACPAFLYA